MSTNRVRDANKNTELFSHGEENGLGSIQVVIMSQASEQFNDSGHVFRFLFLRYTFRELQRRVKFHFETVFLRDIFMHITYVNV